MPRMTSKDANNIHENESAGLPFFFAFFPMCSFFLQESRNSFAACTSFCILPPPSISERLHRTPTIVEAMAHASDLTKSRNREITPTHAFIFNHAHTPCTGIALIWISPIRLLHRLLGNIVFTSRQDVLIVQDTSLIELVSFTILSTVIWCNFHLTSGYWKPLVKLSDIFSAGVR